MPDFHLDLLAILQPLVSVPSPPFWDSFVDLLEKSLNFLAETTGSAGLAVILFTIIVKTIMLPLTIKATRSSRSMQELQPKIKELQKKYKGDKQKLSQETMQMYSQYGVNPMAGCLPMLVQMPIFFGLYRAILHLSNGNTGFEISSAWAGGFLWLPSLADPDPLHILPILAGVFQFIQTRMMRPAGQGKPADPQQAMMQNVMNILPITIVIFGWGFASGPVIYWVTQSVYSVVQQWLITGWGAMLDWFPWLPDMPEHRRLGYKPPKSEEELAEIAAAGPQHGKFMGWFQSKMEEAQRQQQLKAEGGDASDESESNGAEPVASGVKKAPTKSSKKKKKTSAEVAEEEPNESESGELAMPAGNGVPPPVPRKSRSAKAQQNGNPD